MKLKYSQFHWFMFDPKKRKNEPKKATDIGTIRKIGFHFIKKRKTEKKERKMNRERCGMRVRQRDVQRLQTPDQEK